MVACRAPAMATLPGVAWSCWVLALTLLGAAGLARTRAEARLVYRLGAGRHRLLVELRLLCGLWRRHWRIPEQPGQAAARHVGGFARAAVRQTVPGPAPERARGARRAPLWRGLDYLRGRVTLRRLRFHLRVGTGDAALAAMAVGVGHAGLASALALLSAYVRLPQGFRPDFGVVADDSVPHVAASGACIAQVSLGELVLALVLVRWQSLRTRRRPGLHPLPGP